MDPWASYWSNLSTFGFMAEPKRFHHNSHAAIVGALRCWAADREFSLLDIGVLSAVTYQKLMASDLRVQYTGVDVSPAVVADCRERFPSADWRVMDIKALDLPAQSFDVVNVRHVLEHVLDFRAAVAEVSRVTRQVAIFCFFIPVGDDEQVRVSRKAEGPVLCNTVPRDQFVNALRDNFSVIRESMIADPQRANQVFWCEK